MQDYSAGIFKIVAKESYLTPITDRFFPFYLSPPPERRPTPDRQSSYSHRTVVTLLLSNHK